MCGRESVSGCTDELEYSKIHLITVGVQLNAFLSIPRVKFDMDQIFQSPQKGFS